MWSFGEKDPGVKGKEREEKGARCSGRCSMAVGPFDCHGSFVFRMVVAVLPVMVVALEMM